MGVDIYLECDLMGTKSLFSKRTPHPRAYDFPSKSFGLVYSTGPNSCLWSRYQVQSESSGFSHHKRVTLAPVGGACLVSWYGCMLSS